MPRLRTLLISVLALSGLLRVIVYFQNRSLFLDEANLSRNIIEKPYGELFGSLDYEQFCPPMYACTVKLCTQIFGVNEYSLRLFSLLLGLASLYLFYRLVHRLFDSPMALYPILLFGFSIYLMRYQTENKQYAADVFFALLFLWIGLEKKINTWGQFLALGIAGGLGIWFSMPLVFVLTGLGCFLFYQQWISENRVQRVLKWGSMATVWLASFAALYQVNLKASIGNKYLQEYYSNIYLEFPVSFEKMGQTFVVLREFLSNTTDHTVVPLVWASICWLLGIYVLVKKDLGKALLIGLPIASCYLASMLHQFILIPRVGLFLMPFYFILIGLGAEFIFNKIRQLNGVKKYVALVLILLAMVLSILGRTAIPYFFKTYELEHSRPVIQAIQVYPEKNIPVYVIHNGMPAFRFYTQLHEPPFEIEAPFIRFGVWSDQLPQLATEWKETGVRKIWIFDSHTFGEELERVNRDISLIGKTDTVIRASNSAGYLVEF